MDIAEASDAEETLKTFDEVEVEAVKMFDVGVEVNGVDSWVEAVCEARKPMLLFPFLRMVLGMRSLFPMLFTMTQISSLSTLEIGLKAESRRLTRGIPASSVGIRSISCASENRLDLTAFRDASGKTHSCSTNSDLGRPGCRPERELVHTCSRAGRDANSRNTTCNTSSG